MGQLTQRDYRGLLDSLRDLYVQQDLQTYPDHALAVLVRSIPSDLALYGQISAAGVRIRLHAPHAHSDELTLARLEAYLPRHPLYQHFLRTGDGAARRTSDLLAAPAQEMEVMSCGAPPTHPLGAGCEMAILFPASTAATTLFALHRHRRDFSDEERALLELLRPHLAQALGNATVLSSIRSGVDELRKLLEGPNRSVIVLSGRGQVKHWTEQARLWIARYCKTVFPQPAYRLPECFDRWYRQQLSLHQRPRLASPPREPLIVDGHGRQLLAQLIPDYTRDQHLLFLEERSVADVQGQRRALGLSRRECEVLDWVAKGKTNVEVGTILGMSPRTVQKHLENIYRKLGVETRTMAAVRAIALFGNGGARPTAS